MEKDDLEGKPKLEDVIRVLKSLAQGMDPQSGEKCPGESLLNRPEIIRALFAAVDRLQAVRKSGVPAVEHPGGSSRRWTAELDEELKERYLAGAALPELMRTLGRGRGALIGRLKLLGLIDDSDHVRD